MKYALVDNAVVQCDDISNYIILDTLSLFEEKEYRLREEYEPIFDAMRTFLPLGSGICELFVSTHYYFVPCFVREMQKSLGRNIRTIPICIIANNTNLMEYYDYHTIKTVFDNDNYECTISKSDTAERTRQVVDKLPIYKEIGISCITNLNNYIDRLEVQLSSGDFSKLILGDISYKEIVVGEKGFLNFSPFGSLRYYDELMPRVHGLDIFLDATSRNVTNEEYDYVMSTLSGDIPFKNKYQTWINTEKGGSFPIKRLYNNNEKQRALMIPDSLIEEDEIRINDMCFGKFYIDMECDFLGNLHLSIESLSGKTFYQILQFAL